MTEDEKVKSAEEPAIVRLRTRAARLRADYPDDEMAKELASLNDAILELVGQRDLARMQSVSAPHRLAELESQLAEVCERETRYRETFLSICADVIRLPVPPGKDADAWCREQVERMSRNFDGEIAEHARHHEAEDKLRAELAAEREKSANNRKARIVCETAARWVQEKRDRAERAGSSTPWILAVEKELADDVQAYEWAVKEAPPVPAVAETAEKPAKEQPREGLDGACYSLMGHAGDCQPAPFDEEDARLSGQYVEKPPTSAPVERLTRERLLELRAVADETQRRIIGLAKAGHSVSVTEPSPVELRLLCSAAERDLDQHEKEQVR